MSYSEVLAVTPDRRPATLLTLRNSHGWAPSIWRRLLEHRGESSSWIIDNAGLNKLWREIESLPEWQQVPLVLTFDTGVIPWQEFNSAADALAEFEKQCPENPDYVNHVPTVIDLLRTKPEAPFIGVYGTSVSENPFDPTEYHEDDSCAVDGKWCEGHGDGVPLGEMYLLERHRKWLPKEGG